MLGAVTNGDIGDYVETPEMQFDAGDYVLSMLGAATWKWIDIEVDLVRPWLFAFIGPTKHRG